MDSRASVRTRLGVLPVLIALLLNLLLPLSRAGVGVVAAADGISDYSQCQIGNPNAGLDCEAWINGILNATKNNYSEDEVVPQRLVIDFDDTDVHTVTLSYMTRKDSSGANHAYDYLATWNHTYVNADRCQDLQAANCVGGAADLFPIPSDPAIVTPGGPQPTSAHELPQANRQFVMYGGDITATSAITHSVDPAEDGSDYGNITLTFDVTDADGKVMLLFGGHLASGFGPRGWGAGLGAADISGGPYHIRVTAMDGASAGNRDNQIMSNAITPLPGLAITKTTSTPTISAGDVASYTVTVTNSGQGDATGVTVTDTLPAGVTWTDNSANCTISGGFNLSCGPLTIPAASSFSVTVTGTTDAGECPSISNTASFTSTNGGSGNTSSSPTVITVNCPTIRLEKTPDENPQNAGANDVNVGSPATFTITVFNDGAGTAAGVTVFDDLPGTGWSVVAADTTLAACAVTDPADGEHAAKGEILTCGPDSIGGTASKKVTVTKTTTTADCGSIDNTASAASTNDGTDSDTGNIDVLCPQIRVEKTPDENEQNAGANDVNAGDAATFTITIHNDGTGTANGVNLFDDLPGTGWSVVAADTTLAACAVTDPADGEHAAKGEILTCGPDTIGAGLSKKVTVTNPISVGECDDLPNSAGATSSNAGTDTDDGFIAVTCPEIRVEKTPDESEQAPGANDVTAGDAATFTITVHNDGDGAADGVNLFDDLVGDGWSVVAADTTLAACAVTDPADGEHAAKGEILTCGPDTIGAGLSKKVTVTKLTENPEDCGELPNSASATASNAAGDGDSGNIDVLCPELLIDKTTDTPEVNANDQVSYTIAIANDGDGAATDVDITDNLPAGLTWSDDSGACTILANVLSCPDLTIPAGGSFEVTVTGTTDSGDCPSIENTASFTSGNAGSGSSDSEARGATVINVNCPDLQVEKEQVDANGEPTTEPVSAGDTAFFAIHVTNVGLGTAYAVDVLDFAPTGTVWTVVDDGGLTCPDAIDDEGDTCTTASMEPGTATIVLSYETSEADCGLLENNVEVSASNEPAAKVGPDNEAQATITVECPGLNIIKRQVDENGDPTNDPILAGETAYFEILVWNSDDEGIGTAHDVVVTEDAEDLPDGVSWSIDAPTGVQCVSGISTEEGQSFSCDLGDLEPGDEVSIVVSGLTDRADCGALVNTARVDASNNDDEVPPATATILVSCPEIALEKENDAVGSVLPGTTVEYTLTLTVSDEGLENGEATDVVVVDKLPVGLENPTLISDGGVYDAATHTITWELGDLGEAIYELTYQAIVADDVEHGEPLVNAAEATSPSSQCPDSDNVQPECEDESTVTPRVPTLVIDKVADAEVITISGPSDALVADPSVVTWTLTYTLTNGPVTNAVITDEVPAGFEFLDAANGGLHADGVVTWTFETLTESGSVTFRTTVDPETISRTAPTVNTAVIDSDETAPDDGEDSVTVVVEPPPLGGNPTPKPDLPDTAVIIGPDGQPITVPVELLAVFFLGSLGAAALANVRARNRRR